MIHGTCCQHNFNCLEIYGVLHWSLNGECPWCRLGTASQLTESQLFAVCTHIGNGWHAPEFRDPGPPIIVPPNGDFVTCSREDLEFLDHRDATGFAWRSSRVPRTDPIEPFDATFHAMRPTTNEELTPFPDELATIQATPPTSAKKPWIACRCNNCA